MTRWRHRQTRPATPAPSVPAPPLAANAALAAFLSGGAPSSEAGTVARNTAPAVTDALSADATLGQPDPPVLAAGDAASLTGTAATAPAFAAALAGAAKLTAAVAATDVQKQDSGSGDAAATGAQAAAALQAASAPGAAQDAAAPTFKVQAPLDTPDFSQGVATQVSMMVDNKIGSARLQVNPPSLGPIEVRIALQGDHAQVSFTSHSAVTRDALESSSPQLRDMLSSQGFAQVSVDISQRSFQERTPTPHSYEAGRGADPGEKSAVVQPAASARAGRSVLDAYA